MNLARTDEERVAGFPPALRALLDAELAAGNRIVEIASCFPAPPTGAYVMLANPVTTRPRASDETIHFYERNSSSYSGEFTDAKRFHFILEPPQPAAPEPDMDAIRAEREARYAAACLAPKAPASTGDEGIDLDALTPGEAAIRRRPPHDRNSVPARFQAGMSMDYEKWRDGTGYDLSLLKQATPGELDTIENLVLRHAPRDWRDVEVLAALGVQRPRVRAALLDALRGEDVVARMAVHRHAPELLTNEERVHSLVKALEGACVYGGLTQALMEVREFHPPEVIAALWRGLMKPDGGTATHFAAMLAFLHGKASSPFDWKHRPFFLRFNTENMDERTQAVRELRTWLEGGAPPGSAVDSSDATGG